METTPAQLSQEWKSGRFKTAYYLCGEEEAGKRAAVSFLKKNADEFNYREFSETESSGKISEILSELSSLPVSSERKIIVVELPDSASNLKKNIADYLKKPSNSSVLVLCSKSPKPDFKDATTRLVSEIGSVCVFSKLRENEAVQRLKDSAQKQGKRISPEAAEFLVREIGVDWESLSQEIEKAAFYSSQATIEIADVSESLGYRKEKDPFALTRLIEKRLKKEALSHLYSFLNEGKPQEQSFRALLQMSGVILKQLKAKMMLCAGLEKGEIERKLRLHPYWDKGFLGNLGALTEERLRGELKSCLKAEARLKSQAWLDPAIEIERLAASICDK